MAAFLWIVDGIVGCVGQIGVPKAAEEDVRPGVVDLRRGKLGVELPHKSCEVCVIPEGSTVGRGVEAVKWICG